MGKRIYVASSWRCFWQPLVVDELRAAGHDVYDFRHPAPGDDGFHLQVARPNRHRLNRIVGRALGVPAAGGEQP